MITFVTKKGFEYTVREFLKSPVTEPVRDQIQVIPYFMIKELLKHPHHAVIFADHERYSIAEKKAISAIYLFLKTRSPDLRILNDPAKVLVRLPLLNELFRKGVNEYNSYPISTDPNKLRFPVFIRSAYDHHGSISQFLRSEREVSAALKRLVFPYTKYSPNDLMIVEYCHTADHLGYFRKYDAYRVNENILPSSMGKSARWDVRAKYNLRTLERFLEHLEYIKTNPFRDQLASIFEIAGIDYGRIDFAFSGKNLQVWEINTNPMIEGWTHRVEYFRKTFPSEVREVWESARNIFYTGLVAELEKMLERKPARIPTLPNGLVRDLQWAIVKSRIGRRTRTTISKKFFRSQLYSPEPQFPDMDT